MKFVQYNGRGSHIPFLFYLFASRKGKMGRHAAQRTHRRKESNSMVMIAGAIIYLAVVLGLAVAVLIF